MGLDYSHPETIGLQVEKIEALYEQYRVSHPEYFSATATGHQFDFTDKNLKECTTEWPAGIDARSDEWAFVNGICIDKSEHDNHCSAVMTGRGSCTGYLMDDPGNAVGTFDVLWVNGKIIKIRSENDNAWTYDQTRTSTITSNH